MSRDITNLMKKIDKLNIADEMLDKAIECYLDDKKYFAALHLAGAVQQIYGKWLRIEGQQDFSTMMLNHAENLFDEPIDKKAIKKEDMRPKNSIKHMDSQSDRFAYLNPQLDSFLVISEAVVESMMLQREETANIIRFREYLKLTHENGL